MCGVRGGTSAVCSPERCAGAKSYRTTPVVELAVGLAVSAKEAVVVHAVRALCKEANGNADPTAVVESVGHAPTGQIVRDCG